MLQEHNNVDCNTTILINKRVLALFILSTKKYEGFGNILIPKYNNITHNTVN